MSTAPSTRSRGGDPQVILVQRESLLLAPQLGPGILVTGRWWHRLAGQDGKQCGGFELQGLSPLALEQSLDARADFAPDHCADHHPVSFGHPGQMGIGLGMFPHQIAECRGIQEDDHRLSSSGNTR
jgi:hypothetical protein